MNTIHYITSGNSLDNIRYTLWQVGNYQYEIDCRSTGKEVRLHDTTFERASEIFEKFLKKDFSLFLK
jgi:hypothetical protein